MDHEGRDFIEGRFSDGESAKSTPVLVAFGDESLDFKTQDGNQLPSWRYRDLCPAGPIRLDDNDVLLRNNTAPRATLFLKAPLVGERLINHAPFLAARRERLRNFHIGLILAVGVAGLVAMFLFSKVSFSRALAELIPQSAARNIGRQSVKSFTNFATPCKDEDGLRALNKIVSQLASVSGEKYPFELHVVQFRVPNAFALPGKTIVMTSRLIDDAQSADEVAGVLAHEIGHGIEKDAEALFIRSIGMQALIQLFTGQSGDGTGLTLGALLLQLRYSREAERKADSHALDLLQKARIPAKPVANFFRRNKRDEGFESGVLQYLSTHPISVERAKFFEASPDIATKPALTHDEWRAARNVCGSIKTKPPEKPNLEIKTNL